MIDPQYKYTVALLEQKIRDINESLNASQEASIEIRRRQTINKALGSDWSVSLSNQEKALVKNRSLLLDQQYEIQDAIYSIQGIENRL